MPEVEPRVSEADNLPGLRRRDDASHADPPAEPAPEFPGCHPVRMTRGSLEDFEGRLEYWEASTETAWVIAEPTSVAHEGPTRRLGRLAELIGAVRGSPVESYGSMDLVLLDERGEWRRMMQADETLYLHPGRAHLPEVRLVIGEHDLPDVTLEVDYSTDVRRGKLGVYQRWGFPEIWVEVPARYRSRRRPGLTIHLREAGGYREAPESRAFPGWTTAEIHAALALGPLSEETQRVLERVGRRLGAREGTGPDDSPLMRSLRSEARAQGLAYGRTEGRAEGRDEGHAEGRAAGHAEGRAEGRAAGHAEGRAQALADNVRSVLQVRGVATSPDLAQYLAALPDVSHMALVSAAMACEDEADFRARVARMQSGPPPP